MILSCLQNRKGYGGTTKKYEMALRELLLDSTSWPSEVDIDSWTKRCPQLEKLTYVSSRSFWQWSIHPDRSHPNAPARLKLRSGPSATETSSIPIFDPRLGLVGSKPKLSLDILLITRSSGPEYLALEGLHNTRVPSDVARRIFEKVRHFGSIELPGRYHRTLFLTFLAMPDLEHLRLMKSDGQRADLVAAMEVYRVHCPALQSLTLDLPWDEIGDLTKSRALNRLVEQNLIVTGNLATDLDLAFDHHWAAIDALGSSNAADGLGHPRQRFRYTRR